MKVQPAERAGTFLAEDKIKIRGTSALCWVVLLLAAVSLFTGCQNDTDTADITAQAEVTPLSGNDTSGMISGADASGTA